MARRNNFTPLGRWLIHHPRIAHVVIRLVLPIFWTDGAIRGTMAGHETWVSELEEFRAAIREASDD